MRSRRTRRSRGGSDHYVIGPRIRVLANLKGDNNVFTKEELVAELLKKPELLVKASSVKEVIVTPLDGKEFTIKLLGDHSTLNEVKRQIQRKKGIPEDEQDLYIVLPPPSENKQTDPDSQREIHSVSLVRTSPSSNQTNEFAVENIYIHPHRHLLKSVKWADGMQYFRWKTGTDFAQEAFNEQSMEYKAYTRLGINMKSAGKMQQKGHYGIPETVPLFRTEDSCRETLLSQIEHIRSGTY